ncbi:MAG: hypothetical protein LLG37_08915 [Spirochaetia bacterium]|nr:hypothetical protein [Spirochaetia bacterium]
MHTELERFPKFTIRNVIGTSGCVGEFDCDVLFADGQSGYMCADGRIFYRGKFSYLENKARQAKFLPDDPDFLSHLSADRTYAYFDSYWGAIAELILDRTIKWEKMKYNGRTPARRGLCSVCSASIDEENTGYVAGRGAHAGKMACDKCYPAIVKPGNLSFIDDGTILTQIRGLK